jgi:hypothetical protein
MIVSLSTRARSKVAVVCTPNVKEGVGRLRLAPWVGGIWPVSGTPGNQTDTATLTVTDMTRGCRVVERDLPASMRLVDSNGLMAWTDEHTLRLGLVALPANADRLYELSEVLRIETVEV